MRYSTKIGRSESITGAVALTTASREMEIQQLKEELRVMQEKLKKRRQSLNPSFGANKKNSSFRNNHSF